MGLMSSVVSDFDGFCYYQCIQIKSSPAEKEGISSLFASVPADFTQGRSRQKYVSVAAEQGDGGYQLETMLTPF